MLEKLKITTLLVGDVESRWWTCLSINIQLYVVRGLFPGNQKGTELLIYVF